MAGGTKGEEEMKTTDSEMIDFMEKNGLGVRWWGQPDCPKTHNQWEVIWGNEDERISISKNGIRAAVALAMKRAEKQVNEYTP
jgi:hypothetical protein